MLDIFFVFFLIFYKVNCSLNQNEQLEDDDESIKVEPEYSKTYFIEYHKKTNFTFNISPNNYLQINIHGINCNFNLDFTGDTLNKTNLDTYSIQIDSKNNVITVSPLVDIIDGEDKLNYDAKSCPLSINSYLINDNKAKVQIENKEENIFYLNNNELSISYDIKNISNDNFVALSFQVNEKVNLSVNAINNYCESQPYSINKNICNSSIIFLNSTFLQNYAGINRTLLIKIHNNDEKVVNIRFKIIEKDSIFLLEKNALTIGFLTSKTQYQYYYTEVLEGEEGELMLHNKRLYGVLYGKIIDKNETNKELLNDTSIYPKDKTDINQLSYNPHGLFLKFSYENTTHCKNGCYLLITYEQQLAEDDSSLIGYEFTILSRFWNYTDYISAIVDIPFNEYLIGAFEMGSITHHYYSINIPDDADKFIIQIEGNYLDCYYGEGRKKISTIKISGNTKELELYNPQNVTILDIENLNYTQKTMSFAFRPKDYYADVFSFYYFRILYIKKNETIFFPIDSNLGNLCIPEKENNEEELYYCNLIFKNNYNELSTKFAISAAVQNEYFRIYTSIINNTKNLTEESKKFLYIYDGIEKDIDYFIFKFEFQNNEIKNIISCFLDRISIIYPQIYSSQMFFINDMTKKTLFDVKNNYVFNYQHINGFQLNVNFSIWKNETFEGSRNFKGKPMAISINSGSKFITFSPNYYYDDDNDYVYYIKLVYDMKNKGIEEIKSGEVISYLISGDHFPLYYYFKLKNNTHINVDINLRLNSYNETLLQNDFDITGYILDEDTMKRKINGEYIQLKDPYEGYYSNAFKVGLLQINKELKEKSQNNNKYIMIEIKNKASIKIIDYLLVELSTKEYNNNKDSYFLPVNQYTLQTFDEVNNIFVRNENKYYLSSDDKRSDQVLIELSSAYDDITIKFDKKSNVNFTYDCFRGFKKYRVYNATNDDVYFSVLNPYSRRKANYMIRYYYTGLGSEYEYDLDLNPKKEIISEHDDYVNISISFKAIEIKNQQERIYRNDIYFMIYGFLYLLDKTSDEQINTTSILYEQIPLYEDKTKYYYNPYNLDKDKWNLIFYNIPREKNFIYDLQLKVNVVLLNRIYNEEFLIYTTKIDLTDIKIKEQDYITLIIVLSVVGGAIILGLIIFFAYKFVDLCKSNENLRERMKSLAFSNDIQKNVLITDQDISKKDNDYESTFI